MFNFSGSEIVFLLLLALIVLGPEKLPEAVRKFGKTYAEFKKMSTGFQQELKQALDEPMREMRETADAFKAAASFDIDLDPRSPVTDPADRSAETEAEAEAGIGTGIVTSSPEPRPLAWPDSVMARPAPPPPEPIRTNAIPANDIPANDIPANDIPNDIPNGDSPANDIPNDDSPGNDSPSSDRGAGSR